MPKGISTDTPVLACLEAAVEGIHRDRLADLCDDGKATYALEVVARIARDLNLSTGFVEVARAEISCAEEGPDRAERQARLEGQVTAISPSGEMVGFNPDAPGWPERPGVPCQPKCVGDGENA